jgi:hypothetical protein
LDNHEQNKSIFLSSNAVLIYLSLFKFVFLIIFAGNYGLFRDEYYYIECSKNLAFGFVDQQPLSAVILAISRTLLGESLIGIRILSYLAGSVIVFVGGLIARELSGGKFAQALAGFTIIFCGTVLGVSSYFSMNSFDILLSTLMFYYLIKLIKSSDPKYWIYLGIIFGIGLQNKLSFLFLGFGLVVGLILTKHRIQLKSKQLWLGAGLVFLIFLPNIIWQIANDFPTLEFMRNAAEFKNQPMSLLEFTANAMLELNPGFVIFVLIAIYYLFFNKEGRQFLIIGLIFFTVYLVFVLNNGKPYYMGVLFPVILAAGAVGTEYLIDQYLKRWVRVLALVSLIPSAILVVPFATPFLSVDNFLKFSNFLGIRPSSGERSELGALPQFFADRFGWEEMVQKVAEVYNSLPEEDKEKVLIFGQNYGEAGAVDYYREKYGLPKAISSHNNYWIWGYPENYTGEVMIVIGSNLEDNSQFFEEVELAASHKNDLGMPFENVDIFVCRKLKISVEELWRQIKFFI